MAPTVSAHLSRPCSGILAFVGTCTHHSYSTLYYLCHLASLFKLLPPPAPSPHPLEIYYWNKLLFSQILESAPDSYSCSGNQSTKFLESPLIVDVNVSLNQAVTHTHSNFP